MNLRWLWFDHVPPGVDLNDEQRREVRRRSKFLRYAHPSTMQRHRSLLAAILVSGLGEAALMLFIVMYLIPLGRSNGVGLAALVILPFLVSGVFLVIIAMAFNRSHSPFVREALNEMDHPVCMKCGYALRGLEIGSEPSCPECGTKREPLPAKENSTP